MVICSTSGEFDETVNTLKPIIKKSNLLVIKDEQLLQFLEDHIQKSQIHKAIMKFINNNFKKPCKRMQALIEEHRLNKKEKLIGFLGQKLTEIGWETYPSRLLLILDDFASHPMLKKRESPLPRLLKKLRHFNVNLIICVQGVKSITKELKRDLQDIVIFPGISKDDFFDLISETSASIFDVNLLWSHYRKIKNPQTQFRMHIVAGRVFVVPP